jgi:hypothetical protein
MAPTAWLIPVEAHRRRLHSRHHHLSPWLHRPETAVIIRKKKSSSSPMVQQRCLISLSKEEGEATIQSEEG